MYDTAHNILYKDIFTQTEYNPWSCLLASNYSTNLCLLHLEMHSWFMHFWVLIVPNPVENAKEWICSDSLQVIFIVFLFYLIQKILEFPRSWGSVDFSSIKMQCNLLILWFDPHFSNTLNDSGTCLVHQSSCPHHKLIYSLSTNIH